MIPVIIPALDPIVVPHVPQVLLICLLSYPKCYRYYSSFPIGFAMYTGIPRQFCKKTVYSVLVLLCCCFICCYSISSLMFYLDMLL